MQVLPNGTDRAGKQLSEEVEGPGLGTRFSVQFLALLLATSCQPWNKSHSLWASAFQSLHCVYWHQPRMQCLSEAVLVASVVYCLVRGVCSLHTSCCW